MEVTLHQQQLNGSSFIVNEKLPLYEFTIDLGMKINARWDPLPVYITPEQKLVIEITHDGRVVVATTRLVEKNS